MAEVAQRVEDAVGGAVADLGMRIEDVTVTPAGKKRVVRIAVDRDLGDLDPLPAQDDATTQDVVEPLDLDAVADATRAISAVLDDSDVLGSAPYTLEVTSPGVSRPLTLPRHFRRNVGRLVRLVLSGGGTATGRIVAAGTDAVRLRLEDSAGDTPTHEEYPLADVTRGDVQVEFGRPQQTGPDEQED